MSTSAVSQISLATGTLVALGHPYSLDTQSFVAMQASKRDWPDRRTARMTMTLEFAQSAKLCGRTSYGYQRITYVC